MKSKISALKRKIKALEEKHSKVRTQNYFHGINALRFQLSMINEQIMFAERELRDLQENL